MISPLTLLPTLLLHGSIIAGARQPSVRCGAARNPPLRGVSARRRGGDPVG